jgi:hypothetical protein
MGFSFSAPKTGNPPNTQTQAKRKKDNIALGYVILVGVMAVVAVAVGGGVVVRIVENVWVKGGIGWRRSGPGGN